MPHWLGSQLFLAQRKNVLVLLWVLCLMSEMNDILRQQRARVQTKGLIRRKTNLPCEVGRGPSGMPENFGLGDCFNLFAPE
jgi:hypothetical protein